MTTTEIQTALEEVKCYGCLGLSTSELLKLAFARRWLLALDPTADVSLAGLMEEGKCLCCFGVSTFDLLYITLLNLIVEAT